MDANPQEFYNRTVGRAFDVDGSYGFQCWDLWAECCRSNGAPLSVIHCSLTGYVEDTWKLRHKSGILQYFDAVPADQIIVGDWIIWGKDYSLTPKSHVAMAWVNRQSFGQSQSGIKQANLVSYLDWSRALGAFRLKQWEARKMLDIVPGKLLRTTYNDQPIVLLPQPSGTKLGLVSAKEEGKPYSLSRQLIGDIDDPNIVIYGKMNANYFIMNGAEAGQHLGVRVGFGETWEIPMQNAYYWFTIRTDGDTDVGLDVQWPYNKGQVTMACSPALINYRRGAIVNYQSPNAQGSKVYPNTQSMLIRTSDLYIFAMCTGSLSPTQCRNWAMASIPNLQDVMFRDSGGSSCLQDGYNVIYATSERRRIANALVFYSSKDVAPEDTDQTDEVAELRKKITALQIENAELKAMIEKAKEALNYEILK
jgi:hypothetical protein